MYRITKMKKKTKGAISIFLILIFLATYTLSGLLVDGGRYRMAQVLAESALDSANESILSYYNQMLYDLYGLFAVDSESVSEDKIVEVLNNYVKKTLSVDNIDYNSYSTILTQWLTQSGNSEDVKYFDDYDFELNINGGSSVTLASTTYVEDQIIEHMKYRGPIELVTESGFFEKLESIISMGEIIEAVTTKLRITNSRESKSLYEDADELLEDIKNFSNKIKNFCYDPCAPISSREIVSEEYGYRTIDYFYEKLARNLDEELEEIGKYMALPKVDDEGNPILNEETGEQEYETQEEVTARRFEAYEEAKNEFLEFLKEGIFKNAKELSQEAGSLRRRIDTIADRYDEYIARLETEMNKKESEQYQATFKSEIELAKNNCGEIIKNGYLLTSSQLCTNEIVGVDGDISLEGDISAIIDFNLYGGNVLSVKSALDPEKEDYISLSVKDFFENLVIRFNCLVTESSKKIEEEKEKEKEKSENKIKVDKDSKVKTVKVEKTETDKQEVELKDLSEENLKINYTSASSAENSDKYELDNELDTSSVDIILNMGTVLVDTITNILTNARDGIYVNEYIMSTFPNVVDDNPVRINESEFTDLMKKRNSYNATIAEVEYIITGNANTKESVMTVEAQLLAFRTIFNTVAIFMDSVKMEQASALAALISGPFAPLVTIVILLAWAVAESAMDVWELKNGEEVKLFKKGADWTLSIGGAISKCIETATEAAIGAVESGMSAINEQINKRTNELIYEAYKNAFPIDKAKEEAKQIASEVKNGIKEGVSESVNNEKVNTVLDKIDGKVDEKINESIDGVAEGIEKITNGAVDSAIKVINESVNEAFDSVTNEIESGIKEMGKEASEAAAKKIAEALPEANANGSGSSISITMDYNDYLRLFLIITNPEQKIQRIQSLIQANMIAGGNKKFKMEECAVAVWADMECSIRYLFMAFSILPDDIRKDNRLNFKVHSARSY